MGATKFGGANLRGTNFGRLQNFRFLTMITFPKFWGEGKNLPNRLEKKYGNIGWYFNSSFATFLEFSWEFDNNECYNRGHANF